MNIIDSSSTYKTFANNTSGLTNIPLFQVKPLKYHIGNNKFENVVFQSRNSVNFFKDIDSLKGKRVFAMGEGTSLLLKERGVAAITPDKIGSFGLVEFLKTNNFGANTLIVKGKHGLNVVQDELIKMGHHVTEAECYERVKLPSYSELELNYQRADAIIFTSCFSIKIYREELYSFDSRAKLFGISKRICDYAKDIDLQVVEIDYFSGNIKEEIARAI
tara:strand:+ start:289 stop:942 length:654 start_codon:yes stop_codon:yes gene_type:complete